MTRSARGQTRQHLLEEAIRQFGAHGYEGTSLDAVASAAGVRKQTLLYYFPSKEALLGACVGETSGRIAQELTEALDRESSSMRKTEAVIHTVFQLAEGWPEFAQFVREASRLGPDVVERFATSLEPLRRRALAFLANAMDEGVIARQDPALLLFTLYTAVVGSITEAGVLRAVVGEDESRAALKEREEQLLVLIRAAIQRP